jgi:hypothetical protein
MKHLLTTIAALMLLALTAHAQTNRFAATIFAAKTSDQSITNTTNATTITELTFATQANAKYMVTFYPIIEASTTSTFLQVVASNATAYGYWNTIATGFAGTNAVTNATAFNVTSGRSPLQVFYVSAGTNSGTISIVYYSSVATNTNTIKAGSFLRADRMPQ